RLARVVMDQRPLCHFHSLCFAVWRLNLHRAERFAVERLINQRLAGHKIEGERTDAGQVIDKFMGQQRKLLHLQPPGPIRGPRIVEWRGTKTDAALAVRPFDQEWIERGEACDRGSCGTFQWRCNLPPARKARLAESGIRLTAKQLQRRMRKTRRQRVRGRIALALGGGRWRCPAGRLFHACWPAATPPLRAFAFVLPPGHPPAQRPRDTTATVLYPGT